MKFARSSWIGVVIGVVCLGGAYLMVARQTDRARSGSLSVCVGQLRDLCQDHCATLEQTVASISQREGSALHAEQGTCAGLNYTEWHALGQGATAFFDASGNLLGARAWNQRRPFCGGRARWISYGAIQDCTPEPHTLLFSTEGESQARLHWPEPSRRLELQLEPRPAPSSPSAH